LKCNINSQSQKIVFLEEDKEKRKYELFNEIINELISQEITGVLFKLDGYVFNNSDNALISGGTGYEDTVFLVKQFYQRYKKEIIESRKNGNIELLFNAVGKENFEALNELFGIFNEHFSGYGFNSLIENLSNGIENEQTQLFQKIKNRRDKILIAMEEYNKSMFVKKD